MDKQKAISTIEDIKGSLLAIEISKDPICFQVEAINRKLDSVSEMIKTNQDETRA